MYHRHSFTAENQIQSDGLQNLQRRRGYTDGQRTVGLEASPLFHHDGLNALAPKEVGQEQAHRPAAYDHYLHGDLRIEVSHTMPWPALT